MTHGIQKSNVERLSLLWKQHVALRENLGCDYVIDLESPSGILTGRCFVTSDGNFLSPVDADAATSIEKKLIKFLEREKIISESLHAMLPQYYLDETEREALTWGISEMRADVGYILFEGTEETAFIARVWDAKLSAPMRFFHISFMLFDVLDYAGQRAILEFWAGWILSQGDICPQYTQAESEDLLLNVAEFMRFPHVQYFKPGLDIPSSFLQEVRCKSDLTRIFAVDIPLGLAICRYWCNSVSAGILKRTVSDFKLSRRKFVHAKSVEEFANPASEDFINQFAAKEELTRFFRELSESEKEVFILKAYQYTREEIAKIRGVKPETVKTLVKRGKQKALKFSTEQEIDSA